MQLSYRMQSFGRVCLRSALALLACATFGLFPVQVSAQTETGQVTGIVTDARSGGPLSEVQVYVDGLQLGGLSRADGRFLILSVPAGTHDITAQRIGFSISTQSVTVTGGGTVSANFAMSTQALGLDEIVVTGTAGNSRRREIGNSVAQINIADVAVVIGFGLIMMDGLFAGKSRSIKEHE